MNCFALLGLQPAAALCPDDLQRRYLDQLKALRAGDGERLEEESELHLAYQTLRDPVKRLGHLLDLAGASPVRAAQLSGSLLSLFGQAGEILASSAGLLQECRRAGSPLLRALLAEREMATQKDLQNLLAEIGRHQEEMLQRLEGLLPGDIPELQRARGTLAFLEKWRSQLQERLLQFLTAD